MYDAKSTPKEILNQTFRDSNLNNGLLPLLYILVQRQKSMIKIAKKKKKIKLKHRLLDVYLRTYLKQNIMQSSSSSAIYFSRQNKYVYDVKFSMTYSMELINGYH